MYRRVSLHHGEAVSTLLPQHPQSGHQCRPHRLEQSGGVLPPQYFGLDLLQHELGRLDHPLVLQSTASPCLSCADSVQHGKPGTGTHGVDEVDVWVQVCGELLLIHPVHRDLGPVQEQVCLVCHEGSVAEVEQRWISCGSLAAQGTAAYQGDHGAPPETGSRWRHLTSQTRSRWSRGTRCIKTKEFRSWGSWGSWRPWSKGTCDSQGQGSKGTCCYWGVEIKKEKTRVHCQHRTHGLQYSSSQLFSMPALLIFPPY